MSRKEKCGGRHASANGDHNVRDAANKALRDLGGMRIVYNRVIRTSGGARRGQWKQRKDNGFHGGIPVVLYGDEMLVDAVVYVPAPRASNDPPKK